MPASLLSDLEPRVGFGCMRLSTDPEVDEPRAVATLKAALDAGITLFDTARAYARDESALGDNERLLAQVLREHQAPADSVRIVTKGGMRRPEGRWQPDGRARTLREDCDASLEALGGLPIDLYLLHSPDPRVSWATSVRALGSLLEAGLVRRIGVSNVNRKQLDEALALAPIAAVEIAFGPFAETALRGGVLARCIEAGLDVLAHAPLGGAERAPKLSRDPSLVHIASRHRVTPQRVALAAIAELHPQIVPVVGARRPESIRASAAVLRLDDEDRSELERRFGWNAVLTPPAAEVHAPDGPEVVLLMGLQGAGKSRLAVEWVARGYARLNRDDRSGSMAALHDALDAALRSGARRVVLDNTYSTRAGRQPAISIARRYGARVHGLWLDTPLAQAQVNVILRMLEAHRCLLEPEQMARAREPSSLGPGAVLRLTRELETPVLEEGFTSLEQVPFVRRARPGHDRPAQFLALEAAEAGVRPSGELALVFGWKPGATEGELARMQEAFGASVRCCLHPGGPPRCWCRPPLPGLLLDFAVRNGVDPAQSVVVGTKPVHETMARVVGARFVMAGPV